VGPRGGLDFAEKTRILAMSGIESRPHVMKFCVSARQGDQELTKFDSIINHEDITAVIVQSVLFLAAAPYSLVRDRKCSEKPLPLGLSE
jgi:hypothetical protein